MLYLSNILYGIHMTQNEHCMFDFLLQIDVCPALSVNPDIYHFGELPKEPQSTRELTTSACITRNKDIQTNTGQSTSFVYGKSAQQVQLFSE